jgi:hypothetical protein
MPRATWTINNSGWNSPIDYFRKKEKPRIAVIGDSFIAAFQVSPHDSYPSLLRQELGDRYDVYSFGIPGAPLSQYLNLARYADEAFDPDIFIINIVHNDFLESLVEENEYDVHWLRLTRDRDSGGIKEVPSGPNYDFTQYKPWKNILRYSATIRYFTYNVRIRELFRSVAQPELNYHANVNVRNLDASRESVPPVVNYVFGRLKTEFADKRFIIVLDAPRRDIYKDIQSEPVMFLAEVTREHSEKYEFEFIDLYPLMKRDYAENGQRFEFDNDSHWNEYGHMFVSRQLLPYL